MRSAMECRLPERRGLCCRAVRTPSTFYGVQTVRGRTEFFIGNAEAFNLNIPTQFKIV
jgi:hypothetical protein